jgi:hypothetical protein
LPLLPSSVPSFSLEQSRIRLIERIELSNEASFLITSLGWMQNQVPRAVAEVQIRLMPIDDQYETSGMRSNRVHRKQCIR